MSGAPVQLTQGSTTTNTAATAVSPNFGASNTAANLIFYCASYDAGTGAEPTFAIADTVGNSYVKISSVWNAVTGCKTEIGYAKNIGSGTNALTLTVGGGANCYKAIAGWEWSGLDTAAPFTAGEFAEASQTATALSSGNTPTLSTQPAIVIGFSTIKHALVGTTNLTAGSGYTSQGANFWDFGFGAGAQAFAALEYQRVTSTAAIAATFTAATSGNYDTWAVVFKESGTAAAPVIGKTAGIYGPGISPNKLNQFAKRILGGPATTQKGLTEIAGTGSRGTLTPKISVALVQNAATGAVHSVTPLISKALAQIAATGSLGTLKPVISKTLVHNVGTGALGVLTPRTTVALTHVVGTGSVGTLKPGTSKVGVQIGATGAVGSLGSARTIPFTHVVGTGALGNLTVPGNVTVALTGIAAAGVLGNLVGISKRRSGAGKEKKKPRYPPLAPFTVLEEDLLLISPNDTALHISDATPRTAPEAPATVPYVLVVAQESDEEAAAILMHFLMGID